MVGKRFLRWGNRSIWFSPVEITLATRRCTFARKVKTGVTGWLERGQDLFPYARERTQGTIKLRGPVP